MIQKNTSIFPSFRIRYIFAFLTFATMTARAADIITFTWAVEAGTEKAFALRTTSGTNNISIDWGDGSVLETFDGKGEVDDVIAKHAYVEANEYIVTITMDLVTNLTRLNIRGSLNNNNKISSLDITNAPELTELLCNDNQLTTLDITKNAKMTDLYCHRNQLTVLDATKNTKLTDLSCSSNQLTELNITNNVELRNLYCQNNKLATLNATKNTELAYLDCSNNHLIELNITKNTKLTDLSCYNNQLSLTELYKVVTNGAVYTFLNISPQAYTATVKISQIIEIPIIDETAISLTVNEGIEGTHYAYADRILTFLQIGTYTAVMTNSKVTNLKGAEAEVMVTYHIEKDIADKIFFTWREFGNEKTFRLQATSGTNNVMIDWGDGSEPEAFSGTETEDYVSVSHLYPDGKEYNYIVTITADMLTSLTYLDVRGIISNNLVSTLDVTGAPALTHLYCQRNQLTSLDVTNNTALIELWCHENQLITLDIVKNVELTGLFCSDNQLTALDVANNTELTTLYCENNKLKALDLTKNTKLTGLNCYNNQLPLIELYKVITNGAAYTYLNISPQSYTAAIVKVNQAIEIPAIDGVETSIRLGGVTEGKHYTYQNGVLTFLISGIYTVEMTNNKVTNLKGTKERVTVSYRVEKMSFIWTAEAGVEKTFTLEATSGTHNIAIDWGDGSEPEYFNGRGTVDYVYPKHTYINSNDYTVTIMTISTTSVLYLDIAGKSSNNNNMISSLDISGIPELEYLNCYNNQLTELDLTKNTKLYFLSCEYNQLTKLDVRNNTKLGCLYCNYNNLTKLDVRNNTELTNLYFIDNQLTELDITKNIELKELRCYNNQLTELDVTNNMKLRDLSCPYNFLKELNIANNTELTQLNCGHNELTELDVTNNRKLTLLSCYDNQLIELDLTNNTELRTFHCRDNQLSLTKLHKALTNGAAYTNLIISPQAYAATVDINQTIDVPMINGRITTLTIHGATQGTHYTYQDEALTFLQAGTYTVIMGNGQVANTSGDTAQVNVTYTVVDSSVGLNNIALSDVQLYPNPATTYALLTGLPENSIVTIYDMHGRVIKSYYASDSLQINIDFASGIYVVQVAKDGNKVTRKLIVK